jgi:hypothetical protein
MDMSWENTGQVRIWSWFDDFWQSYAPFTLKIIRNFQFMFINSPRVQHNSFNSNLTYGYVMRKYRSSSNLVMVRWFLAELCPFYFENNMKFSVFVHYLPNGTTHSTWHIDASKECAGQVQIWSLFNDFWQSYCPFHFENIMKFSVSLYYLPNSTKHSTQIWHMDMFLECPGQVRIWSWFNDFWQNMKFTVSIHYLPNSVTYST